MTTAMFALLIPAVAAPYLTLLGRRSHPLGYVLLRRGLQLLLHLRNQPALAPLGHMLAASPAWHVHNLFLAPASRNVPDTSANMLSAILLQATRRVV